MKKNYGLIVKLVAFVLLCVVFLLFVDSDIVIKQDVEYIDISKNSNLYYNEQLVCVGDINKYSIQDAQFGDEIRVEKKIGSKKIINPVLAFNNSLNLAYEVRIEGKKVAELGMKAKKDSVVCDNFIIIPLENIQNKKIEIIFKVINGNSVKYVPRLMCMNGLDIDYAFFTSNIDYLLIGIILVEIGLLMLVFMVVNVILKIFNKKNVYISLVSIFAGLWMLSCYQTDSYLLNNLEVGFYAEYITFALTLIFANFYVQELYKDEKERDVLKVLNMILIITVVMVVLLQVVNKVYIGDSIVAVQIHAVPLVVFLVKKYIVNIKGRKEEHDALTVRLVIIAGLAMVCFGLVLASKTNNADALKGVILVYIMIIYQATYAVVVEMNDSYIMHAEKKGISKLAYLDTLTGIQNRRGMEKYVKKIEDKQLHRMYNVCSFDLNKLKHTNDTYGHAAGDILLKNFAKALESCVDAESEYCGRIGGDEFIAIVTENRADEFIKELDNYIKSRNDTGEYQYEVSYAFGIATYESFAGKDIYDSIRMADYFMYEMKGAYERRENIIKRK